MYDLRWIRENPEAFDAGLAARGLQPLATDILARDELARAKRTALQKIQNRRNALSKQVGAAKSKGEEADNLIAEVGQLKGALQQGEEAERELMQALRDILVGLPNRPEEGVPVGEDEEANVVVCSHGDPTKFDFWKTYRIFYFNTAFVSFNILKDFNKEPVNKEIFLHHHYNLSILLL